MQNPFDDLEVEETVSESGRAQANPFDDLEAQFQERESIKRDPGFEARAVGQQFARRLASKALGTPRTIADLLKYGSRYLAQKGAEQQIKAGKLPSQENIKFTERVLKGFGFPSDVLDKINYPSSERFEEMIKSFYDLGIPEEARVPLEATSGLQKAAQTVGGTIGEFLPLGGIQGLPARAAEGLLFGSGMAGGEALGLSEPGQLAAGFALPAVLSIIEQIRSGKIKLTNPVMESLKEYGQEIGLTAEELVPLLQSEGKISALAEIAKPSIKAAESLKGAEAKITSAMDKISQAAAKLPPAKRGQINELLGEFDTIQNSLRKSKMPGDDKIAAINRIENMINRIGAEGLAADEIIATWRDINNTVNWNAFSGGKKDLAKVKKPFLNLLKDIDPKIASDFEKSNKLYSNLKTIESAIGTNKYKKFGEYGKKFALLGALAKSAVSLSPSAAAASIGTYLTADLAQKLATKMLTDPKYQQITLRGAQAIKSGSKAVGKAAFNQLRDKLVEDFPEESKEVDWNSFKES